MKYDLVRPCAECPFRTDVHGYLTGARARQIAHALTAEQATFSCHKTVDYSDDCEGREGDNSQHCAGAMILLEKIGRPNQMMRICERLGMYNPDKLDMKAPVHKSLAAFIAHHARLPLRNAAVPTTDQAPKPSNTDGKVKSQKSARGEA